MCQRMSCWAGHESSAEETRPAISTGKANGRHRLLAAQGTTAAFGCGRSLHLTARHAVKKALMARS